MEEPFKPTSLSIRGLFGNTDAFYKIPQYQRPYKWEDEQVDKLWDDIYQGFENNEENYFLGSIITAKPREDEKSAYVDVVDGQQRLTTLMILFCVVRDLFPNINEGELEENPLAVDIDSIKTSIQLHGKASRLKLFTHRQHQTDFESLIIGGNTKKIEKPYKYQIHTDEEPKYKFLNTAFIFRSYLEKLEEKRAAEFINYLFNQVKIIRIDCKNREFAIKLFQVLNDRGMDLTAADLIKSFLIERLYNLYKDDMDTSKLKEEQFIADWREMENNLKDVEDVNLNDMFIIYEYYLLGQNPKKSLYDELQDLFKGKDPNVVIGDIKNFVSTYKTEIFNKKDKALYSFWYIRWNMYWKTILLSALHSKYSNFDELKHELRRFYYLYWIAGKTLTAIKQTSFNLVKWIKEGKSIDEIRAELNKKLTEDNIVEAALTSLSSKNIAQEPWCKPLLIMMEYNATDDSKLSYIELAKDLHLEHIMPVEYDKYDEWKHITPKEYNTWLNSAGNLTLLSGAKNIEASNNPFDTKMNVYKGKGKYEQKDDKITAFQVTQKIVEDYNSNKFGKQWNIDSMQDRWNWFFDEVSQLLEIDVKEAKEKHLPKEV